MDQKQLDELGIKKNKGYGFEDEEVDAEDSGDSENSEEMEEKVKDIKGIIDDGEEDQGSEEEEEDFEAGKADKKKEKTNEGKKDDWDWEEDDKSSKKTKPGRGWKIFSGVLLLLLIAAVYTHGFNFKEAAATSLTKIEAEDKVVEYVNGNLLQPPFKAEVVSSEELSGLFKVKLSVAGQEIDSYATKDGKYFFPQGFNLEAGPLSLNGPEGAPVEVLIEGEPMKGEAKAKVVIVEFSEFQCPFCGKYFEETYPEIVKNYVETGKVKYVFRNFPLDFHPNAKPAAIAAECAYEQGKFWEYHDKLFSNQANLSLDNYKKWAKELGLDTETFWDCLDTEKYKKEVEEDLADGQKYGVSGTPAFFINGRRISGAQPYEVFKQAIDEALAAETEEEEAGQQASSETAAEAAEGAAGIEAGLPEEKAEEEITAAAPEGTTAEEEPAVKEIQMTVKRWRFDPKHIEIKEGDKVRLVVTSELDTHLVLAGFGLDKEILTGKTETLEFTADKAGVFEFNCGTYCLQRYGAVQGGALKGEIAVS